MTAPFLFLKRKGKQFMAENSGCGDVDTDHVLHNCAVKIQERLDFKNFCLRIQKYLRTKEQLDII